MKAAFIIKDYNSTGGGAERYLAQILEGISRGFDEIDLIVNSGSGPVPGNVTLIRTGTLRISSSFYPLMFNRAVRRILREKKYDVVYGLTQVYPVDVYRAGGGLEHRWFDIRYRSKCGRAANIFRLRNAVRLYMENRIFEKGNYKKIITNSRMCMYEILQYYDVAPEDIFVIYNGVNRDIFNPAAGDKWRMKVRKELGIPEDAKVILFMANNRRRKGFRELVKAAGLIGRDDIWIVAAGKGRKVSGKGKVICTGPVEFPERYYGAADVFVLPTYYDPCANVCLEALACGLPVVTTRTNGAREFIVPGKNGFIIDDPGDINDMAECIKKSFEMKGFIDNACMRKNAEDTVKIIKDALENDTAEADTRLPGRIPEGAGIVYKRNKRRSVERISAGGERFFIKRHFRDPGARCAEKEWRNIFRLRALGIDTMCAFCRGRNGSGSFIITKEVKGERLEDLMKREDIDWQERRGIVYELASAAGLMHKNRLFHKDFYSGHIFLKKRKDNSRGVCLIDLQRVSAHTLFFRRRCVKDIASLNFSVKDSIFTNTDRMRFLRRYFQKTGLRRRRQFIKSILAKTGRIEKHTQKMLLRRKAQ